MTITLAFAAGLLAAGPLSLGLLWIAARIGDRLPDDDPALPAGRAGQAAITPFFRMKHP